MSSSEGIPIRHLIVNDPKDNIPLHLGETPGGSIFSTTPGGTRIYYDRAFLLSRRDSPMTRSPPPNLTFIPEVTLIPETSETLVNNSNEKSTSMKKGGDDQFSMDM